MESSTVGLSNPPKSSDGRESAGAGVKRLWLVFAVVTTVFWGVWGAFMELPEKAGFPTHLGYTVWAIVMIPPALVALWVIDFKLDRAWRSVFLGSVVGFLGAGGQLILFEALRTGPAYLVFPIISLYPVLTVLFSLTLLHERASRRCWIGIGLALPAIVLLSYQPPGKSIVQGYTWLLLAAIISAMWGIQAYVMKLATSTVKPESVFFYMMLTAVLLIPVAIARADFSRPIEWGFRGPYLTALIQSLNSVGALALVYAVRYGKAIIVVPMTALAPVLTVILSLIVYQLIPGPVTLAGIVLASVAMVLMAE